MRDGVAIAGAPAASYVITNDDTGRGVAVNVTYTDLAGFDETLTSAVTTAEGFTGLDLTDTAGADLPIGGSDNDRLQGLGGNDLLIGAGEDTMDGGDGIDTVLSTGSSDGVNVDLSGIATVPLMGPGPAVGSLPFGGDATGDVLLGFENVTGSGFDDVLTGDEGRNVLIGGAGSDTFVFTGFSDNANIDRILDFDVDRDVIELDGFSLVGLVGDTLTADRFGIAADGLATTADQVIIYNSTTGAVSFDGDGVGGNAGQIVAILDPNLMLTTDNFAIESGSLLF